MTSAILARESDDAKDLIAGFHELTSKVHGYHKAEQYYLGTRPEFFADRRFKRALERTGTTFRLNYANTPVDTLVERLEITSIDCLDKPSAVLLRMMWEECEMDLESMEIHRRTAEFGDGYLVAWPNDSIIEADDRLENVADEIAELDPDNGSGLEIYYNDPRTMRLFYDNENPRLKSYAIKVWEEGDKAKASNYYRVNLYYSDRIEKWKSRPGAKGDVPADWDHFDDGGGWWIDNPYGEVPVFHFRTDRPYGIPEHIGAYGPQDIITKTVITHMNTMDYHGFPQRYALLGGDLADGDEDAEDFLYEDDSPANAASVDAQNRSSLKAKPGELWMLKAKSVGEFTAAQPNVFLEPLAVYIRAMAQLTRTPVHRFDESGNPPSGMALRVAEAPFIKKVKNRQLSFGSTWKQFFSFCIKVWVHAGMLTEASAKAKATPVWENPSAQNDQMEWDIAMLKRDAGVPIRQVLLESGYTKEILDDWGVPESKFTPPPAPAPPLPNLPPLRINPLSPADKIQ